MKRNTGQEERAASGVKHRKPNLKGIPTMILGLLLVVAALVLACYNIWDEQRAGLVSNDLLNSLESAIVTGQQEETARGVPIRPGSSLCISRIRVWRCLS